MNAQTASTQQQVSFTQQIGNVLQEMSDRLRERISELLMPAINRLAMQKQLDPTAIGKIARIVQKSLSQKNAPVSEQQIVAEVNAAVAKVVPIRKNVAGEDAPDDSEFTPAQKLHIKEFFAMADVLVGKKDGRAFKQLIELAENDKILRPYHVDKLKGKAMEMLG